MGEVGFIEHPILKCRGRWWLQCNQALRGCRDTAERQGGAVTEMEFLGGIRDRALESEDAAPWPGQLPRAEAGLAGEEVTFRPEPTGAPPW